MTSTTSGESTAGSRLAGRSRDHAVAVEAFERHPLTGRLPPGRECVIRHGQRAVLIRHRARGPGRLTDEPSRAPTAPRAGPAGRPAREQFPASPRARSACRAQLLHVERDVLGLQAHRGLLHGESRTARTRSRSRPSLLRRQQHAVAVLVQQHRLAPEAPLCSSPANSDLDVDEQDARTCRQYSAVRQSVGCARCSTCGGVPAVHGRVRQHRDDPRVTEGLHVEPDVLPQHALAVAPSGNVIPFSSRNSRR